MKPLFLTGFLPPHGVTSWSLNFLKEWQTQDQNNNRALPCSVNILKGNSVFAFANRCKKVHVPVSVMKEAISACLWHVCDPEKTDLLSSTGKKGQLPKTNNSSHSLQTNTCGVFHSTCGFICFQVSQERESRVVSSAL